MVSLQSRREGVGFFQHRKIPQRRSCVLLEIGRSSFCYKGHPAADTELINQLIAIAGKHKRYGSPRAYALLRRAGTIVNHKRVERVWKEQGFSLPRRKKRKRCKKKQNIPMRAEYPNHVWTYDFVHDVTDDGRKLKFLTVLDEFTRKSLKIEADRRIPATSVVAVLQQLFLLHGAPQYVRSDNGPEFIAGVTQAWLKAHNVQTRYIDPGSPWQNAYGESFNDKLRSEWLNMEIFYNVAEAKILTEQWRLRYNNERPHSSLGYLTPREFAENWTSMNVGALPPHPRSLSLFGLPEKGQGCEGSGLIVTQEGADRTGSCPLSVQSPASALGSLSSVALSSGRADIVYHKTDDQNNNNSENQQTKDGILTL